MRARRVISKARRTAVEHANRDVRRGVRASRARGAAGKLLHLEHARVAALRRQRRGCARARRGIALTLGLTWCTQYSDVYDYDNATLRRPGALPRQRRQARAGRARGVRYFDPRAIIAAFSRSPLPSSSSRSCCSRPAAHLARATTRGGRRRPRACRAACRRDRALCLQCLADCRAPWYALASREPSLLLTLARAAAVQTGVFGVAAHLARGGCSAPATSSCVTLTQLMVSIIFGYLTIYGAVHRAPNAAPLWHVADAHARKPQTDVIRLDPHPRLRAVHQLLGGAAQPVRRRARAAGHLRVSAAGDLGQLHRVRLRARAALPSPSCGPQRFGLALQLGEVCTSCCRSRPRPTWASSCSVRCFQRPLRRSALLEADGGVLRCANRNAQFVCVRVTADPPDAVHRASRAGRTLLRPRRSRRCRRRRRRSEPPTALALDTERAVPGRPARRGCGIHDRAGDG